MVLDAVGGASFRAVAAPGRAIVLYERGRGAAIVAQHSARPKKTIKEMYDD
jgi:hypothetical protein